jgi:hypothetical protein
VGKFYIGIEKCCGAIPAALVSDERTKAKDVGEFVKDVIESGLELQHIETDKITIARCKCGGVGKGESRG